MNSRQFARLSTMNSLRKKKKDYTKYRVSIAKAVHYCCICDFDILIGQECYDGGAFNRAHVRCADKRRSYDKRT